MVWGPKTRIAVALVCTLLASCGNEDAFVGPGGGGTPGPGDPTAAEVESITLLAGPSTLKSDAIDDANGVTITAIARDADNNVVPGIALDFSADSGALNVADSVTGDNGRATAILTTGGDPSNRTVTVSVGAGDTTETITVDVVGTQLAASGPPSIESGESEDYVVTLRDAGGIGLRDVTVTATSANGNAITPAAGTTNVDGRVTFAVNGSTGGQDTLTFSGLNMSASVDVLVSTYGLAFIGPAADSELEFGDDVDVEVELRQNGAPLGGENIEFSTTRGTLSAITVPTDGSGRAIVNLMAAGGDGAGPVLVTATGPDNVSRKIALEFVATNPTSVTTQVEPSTIAPGDEAQVIAVVRDPDGNPVKNQTVRFSLTDLSGGSLSASSDITDSQGIARSTYVASNASSGIDGVEITAEFGDPIIASDVANITVAAPTMFMVLGTDNRIEKNDAEVTYDKVFSALITDAAGNPAPAGTVFRLTLRGLEYQKGAFIKPAPDERWAQVLSVPDTDTYYGTPGPYYGFGPFGCRSEDPTGSGNINLADDYNNNDQIDPPGVAQVPATAEISEDGIAVFTVRWPQSYAMWVLVRLTATASVDGTESTRRMDFVLPMASADAGPDETPPNIVSPFGIAADCTDAT